MTQTQHELRQLTELLNAGGVDAVATYMKDAGTPTEGPIAGALWELASSNRLPVELARRVYEAAGYQAFAGYPLIKLSSGTPTILTER